MAHQAQETFVAELDGGPLLVQKGAVLPDTHAAVRLDAGRGVLFRPLDFGDQDNPPAKAPRARKAAAAASVPAGDAEAAG